MGSVFLRRVPMLLLSAAAYAVDSEGRTCVEATNFLNAQYTVPVHVQLNLDVGISRAVHHCVSDFCMQTIGNRVLPLRARVLARMHANRLFLFYFPSVQFVSY